MRRKRRRGELENDAGNKKLKTITDVETKSLPPRLVICMPMASAGTLRPLTPWPHIVGWDWEANNYNPYIRVKRNPNSSETPSYEVHTLLDWETLLGPRDHAFLTKGREQRIQTIANDLPFPLAAIIQGYAPFEETIGSFWIRWHQPPLTLRRPVHAQHRKPDFYITGIGFLPPPESGHGPASDEEDDIDECMAARDVYDPDAWQFISCGRWCGFAREWLNFPGYTTEMRYVMACPKLPSF